MLAITCFMDIIHLILSMGNRFFLFHIQFMEEDHTVENGPEYMSGLSQRQL